MVWKGGRLAHDMFIIKITYNNIISNISVNKLDWDNDVIWRNFDVILLN